MMGPGHLAVERYLGPCLISHRKPKKPPDDKPRYYHHHHGGTPGGGWAGGVPLISLQASARRTNNKKPQQDHQADSRSPLSRLAIHTQGAPLILSNGSNYGRKGGKPLRLVLPAPSHQTPGTPPSSSPPTSSAGSDTQSVASDESHSESCLPRIIKPRKRRKKERKPTTVTEPMNNPSIVTLQPYVPLCYEFDKFRQRSSNRQKTTREPVVTKVEEPPSPVPTPTESYTELEEHDPLVCQCCDPVSQIWDFGRRCFSPVLSSSSRLASLPVLRPCAAEFPWYLPPHEGLRRSQSEPVQPPPPPTTPKPCEPSRPLEVTSEIVTAHDGHRDIEIRFFLPREE